MSANSAVIVSMKAETGRRPARLVWVITLRTVMLFTVVFTLALIAEGALRLWYRSPIVERYFSPSGDVAGYGLAPSQRYEYLHNGRRVTVTTDETGRRVVPGAPAAALHTLHVIGDSQTFGWGISDDETIPARLQQLLGPEWRVVNWGVPGYGPFSYSEALRHVPQGDFSVVIQAEVNDLQDAFSARSPLYSRCGYLLSRTPLAQRLPCWVLGSYLIAAVTGLVIRESGELPLPVGYSPYGVPAAKVLAFRVENLYRDGIGEPPKPVLFAIVPWDAAVLPARLENYRPRLTRAERFVGLPDQLQVENVFRNAPNRETLFQKNDSHLSPSGASLFAERLAPAVRTLASGALKK